MSQNQKKIIEIVIKKPQIQDGRKIWDLIKRTGNLDLNSEYCYFMTADLFSDQCAIALNKNNQEILGVALCINKPKQKDTLFVWQICVDQKARGNGLAKRMISFIVNNQKGAISHIQATITEDNTESKALFNAVAKHYKTDITKEIYIKAENFSNSHNSEYIYNIGKLNY